MFKNGGKTCGSARLILVSLVFGDCIFHSFSVHHSSTDAHKNTRTLTSGVSLSTNVQAEKSGLCDKLISLIAGRKTRFVSCEQVF